MGIYPRIFSGEIPIFSPLQVGRLTGLASSDAFPSQEDVSDIAASESVCEIRCAPPRLIPGKHYDLGVRKGKMKRR